MRVLVCGSRDWTDKAAIRRELERLWEGINPHPQWPEEGEGYLILIHGCCRGADQLSEVVYREMTRERPTKKVLRFPADWNQHGLAAGPIRNRQMLEEGRPDLVLCFHADLANSKGSKDMVEQAEAAGVEVRVIPA